MTDPMEMKVFIAALVKDVIMQKTTYLSPEDFNEQFAKIYDFLSDKLKSGE